MAGKGRFRETCLRKLKNLPKSPCPMARLRLELVAKGKRESEDLAGCPWACTSAQDGYCFWSFVDRFDFAHMETKEIAEMLSLSPAQVLKAEEEAIQKLKADGNLAIIKLMAQTAQELDRRNHDNSVYMTESSTVSELEGLAEESGAIAREIHED